MGKVSERCRKLDKIKRTKLRAMKRRAKDNAFFRCVVPGCKTMVRGRVSMCVKHFFAMCESDHKKVNRKVCPHGGWRAAIERIVEGERECGST